MTPEPRSDGTNPKWWFNSKTKEVEFGRLSPAPHRIGPFDSEAEARRAEEIVAERAAKWKAEEDEEKES